MIGFFKLFFDLTLYYALSGYYLVIIFNVPPAFSGFLALVIAIAAVQCLKNKVSDYLRYAIMLLPPLVLLFWPGLTQAIHMLIAWGYLVLSVFRNKFYLPYEEFRSNFRFGLCSLFAVLPCYIFSLRTEAAFAAGSPYAALMICAGICLLRLLRENTAANTRQVVLIFGFGALCLLLSFTPLPGLAADGVRLLYNYVLLPAVQGLGLLVALVVFGILQGIAYVLGVFFDPNAQSYEVEGSITGALQDLGVDTPWTDDGSTVFWLRLIFGSLFAIGAIVSLVVLFKRLFGTRGEDAQLSFADHREAAEEPPISRRGPLLRPRNPRLAVRYYYAKYLRECRKRGLHPAPNQTSQELARVSREYFPGEDPAQLRSLYVTARYSDRLTIEPEAVDQAANFWRQLKHTKFPPNS